MAYVPQGRRVWPSLSVDETLRLVARAPARGRARLRDVPAPGRAARPRRRAALGRRAADAGDRPRPAAAVRASWSWTSRPRAWRPVIVEQVAQALRELAAEGEIAVLLIEQNLGVAIVGGRPHRRDGQRPHRAGDAGRRSWPPTASCRSGCWACAPAGRTRRPLPESRRRCRAGPPRRSSPCGAPMATARPRSTTCARHGARLQPLECRQPAPVADIPRASRPLAPDEPRRPQTRTAPRVFDFPVAASSVRAAYVGGTFDTKARELFFLRQCLERLGLRVVTVDLSPPGGPRRPACIRAKWRATTRKANRPCSATTAAARPPPWPRPSTPSSPRGATWAA